MFHPDVDAQTDTEWNVSQCICFHSLFLLALAQWRPRASFHVPPHTLRNLWLGFSEVVSVPDSLKLIGRAVSALDGVAVRVSAKFANDWPVCVVDPEGKEGSFVE